jgi:FkbM family methyltransferase
MPSLLDYGLRALARLGLPGIRRAIHALRPLGRIENRSAPFETRFAGYVYKGSLFEHIDSDIFYFGQYAPVELSFLTEAAKRRPNPAGLSYFDIGANVGQHSLWMSRLAKRVFAFEPSAKALAQLRGNLERNAIDNVTLFEVALGDARAQATLGTGFPNNSGSRSLLWTLSESDGDSVEVVRGDDFFAENALPKMDVLKIDVEGFESRVFSGLRGVLRRDRPIILMELLGSADCKSGFASEQELRLALYPDHALYSLKTPGRLRLRPFDWNVEALICLPAEAVPAFRDLIET